MELVGKFDPVLDTHLRKIKTHEIQNHYLGKDTKNKLLDIMATATLNEILKRVKAAKYYAIILDCTPNISHPEEMSQIIRYMSDGNLAPPGVYEHFIKFAPGLSVKPLSITRWECRIDSVKAIRYQIGEVDALVKYDAFAEISEITNEPMVTAEAESLANQLKDYKFCVLIVWYEVLFKVNYVSKELQGETKDINEGMESFENSCHG